MLYVFAAGLLLVAVVLLILRPLLTGTAAVEAPVAPAATPPEATATSRGDDDLEAAIAARRARMSGREGGAA